MIVSFVNVVVVHSLVMVFLLKDRIYFVLIVVNESNTIKQKIIVIVVVNVVLLVIITKQIKTKRSFFSCFLSFFFIQRAFVMETKTKKNWTIGVFFFLNDKQIIQFSWVFFFVYSIEEKRISKSSFLPFYSFISFSLHCVSFFFSFLFVPPFSLSLSHFFFPPR
jgi:hypothetical protein